MGDLGGGREVLRWKIAKSYQGASDNRLSGEADGFAHIRSLCDGVEAVQADRAASVFRQRDRILIAVVIPAPFEPSMAKMLPWRHIEVDASQQLQLGPFQESLGSALGVVNAEVTW